MYLKSYQEKHLFHFKTFWETHYSISEAKLATEIQNRDFSIFSKLKSTVEISCHFTFQCHAFRIQTHFSQGLARKNGNCGYSRSEIVLFVCRASFHFCLNCCICNSGCNRSVVANNQQLHQLFRSCDYVYSRILDKLALIAHTHSTTKTVLCPSCSEEDECDSTLVCFWCKVSSLLYHCIIFDGGAVFSVFPFSLSLLQS